MTGLLRTLFFVVVARPLVLVFLGLNVRHGQRIPRVGPAVILANHNSHLDTLVLCDLIGPERLARFRPVAAGDYFGTEGALHDVVRALFNVLPIVRGKTEGRADPIAAMSEAIGRGESLILFPEGTRGEPERMSRFRTGVGVLLAKHPGLPVIPVHLKGLGRVMPKGAWYPVPFGSSATVGAARTYAGEPAEIAAAIEADVRELGA
jgi:1-acyl-sn-glycerol-3-phosphate acyltransferase